MPSHLEVHPLSDEQKQELIAAWSDIEPLLVSGQGWDTNNDPSELKKICVLFMDRFKYREKVGGEACLTVIRVREKLEMAIGEDTPPRIFIPMEASEGSSIGGYGGSTTYPCDILIYLKMSAGYLVVWYTVPVTIPV
ncbi:hypothetical protein TOPH_04251 [Tolypocladium ophioglossoides CBS 100239]|uniref:Uncharacterized protein n=1 Tax=Tolypocladium ophioglossoides (strain CBS 100239) TaxID=1163406 RepID=A0A0L0NA96_TOLOC|nr:hypothetical protein TOPH_04251 [Tolypocladium ophioglossoides CBS 100239]